MLISIIDIATVWDANKKETDPIVKPKTEININGWSLGSILTM